MSYLYALCERYMNPPTPATLESISPNTAAAAYQTSLCKIDWDRPCRGVHRLFWRRIHGDEARFCIPKGVPEFAAAGVRVAWEYSGHGPDPVLVGLGQRSDRFRRYMNDDEYLPATPEQEARIHQTTREFEDELLAFLRKETSKNACPNQTGAASYCV